MPKRFLSLDEIVAEASTIIPGEPNSNFALIARLWCYIALREIGPSSDHIEVCTLYPENLSLRKPDDYYKALDLGLFTGTPPNGVEVLHTYRYGNKRVHTPRGVAANQVAMNIVEVSEDDHFFYLSSNGSDVTYALLRYFKLPVDANGSPVIPESYRLPIIFFIRYMWALRTGDPNWPNFERVWRQARAEARSRSKIPNGLHFKEIAKSWVTLIPNMDLNQF